MEKDIPIYDLPKDFLVGDCTARMVLNNYSQSPFRVSAGFFIFCNQGTIVASINAAVHTIGKNDFVILIPNCYIQIHSISEDAHLYFVGFSSEFLSNINLVKSTVNYLPFVVEHPVTPLPEKAARLYEDTYLLLIRAYSLVYTLNNKYLIKAFLIIFIQGTAEIYKRNLQYTAPVHSRTNEIYKTFIKLVLQHYSEQHSVSFYAEQLGLSLPHFCTSIRKAVGYTPGEVISMIIIMNAKDQLQYTDKSIKEIAFALGFTNMSFFNKYFRQHTGKTPQEYRRQRRV